MQQQPEQQIKQPTDMTEKPVIVQDNFYSDKLSGYLLLLVVGLAISAILFLMLSYIFATKPKPKYFLTDEYGQVFEQESLDQPMYNEAQIKDWSAQAIIRIFNFNFLNYETEVSRNKSLFTDQAFSKYATQLQSIELPTVLNGKFVAKLSLCDVATIDEKTSGVFQVDNQNKYVWTVGLPVYIQYQNKTNKYTVVTKVLVRVQRESNLKYVDGLVISDISFTERVNVANNSAENFPVCNG